MAGLVQQVMAGLAAGALYALCGLALWLGLAAAGTVNLALAGALGLALLVALLVLGHGLPLVLALPLAMLCGAVLAAGAELLGYRLLRGRRGTADAGGVAVLLAALALWMGLERLAALLAGWWWPGRVVGAMSSAGLDLDGWSLPVGQPLALVVLLLAAGALWLSLARSWLGPALRAIAADPLDAALSGVDVRRALLESAVLAGALAGLAGVLAAVSGAAAWLDPGAAVGLGRGLVTGGLAVALAGERLGATREAGAVGWVVLAGLVLGLAEAGCAAAGAWGPHGLLAPGLLLGLALWPPAGDGAAAEQA